MLGQPADIVVALDAGSLVAVGGSRFDHIRVNGALHQEFGGAEFFGCPLENTDEFLADDLALLLGVDDALKSCKELRASLHRYQFGAHLLAEGFHHLLRFALAQQAGIHEDRHLLVTNGFMHQRGGDGRIHSARDRRQDAFPTHLGADARDTLFDDGGRRPVGGAAAYSDGKMFQQRGTARGMFDLGMELHGEIPAGEIAHGGNGAVA
jgi:hypothetical protein